MDDSVVMWVTWVSALMLGVPLLHTIIECRRRDRDGRIRVMRWWITCIIIVLISLASGFLCGMVGFFIAHFSVIKPSPVSTHCKILTNSVDLRSSKVCQLGFMNYNAKNVLLASERTRYRCHYDYYWASVFQVEYMPHASSRPIQAAAEAPKEALPLDCRPTFSSAWRTKDEFKVNETYHCKYTPGKSKVDIVGDNFFNCFAKEPSIFELIHRLTLIFWHWDQFSFSKKSSASHLLWKLVASIFVGMSLAILVACFVRAIRGSRFFQLGGPDFRKADAASFEARVQFICICTASLFIVIWLGSQREEFSRLYQLFFRGYFEGSRSKKWWDNLQKGLDTR